MITGSVLKVLALNLQQGNPIFPRWMSAKVVIEKSYKPNKSHKVNPKTNNHLLFNKSLDPQKKLIRLTDKWNLLASRNPDLTASAYLFVLDDGHFAILNSDQEMPAASSIKIPILLATLEKIDSGAIAWNDKLELTKEVVGGGAGWMAFEPLGTSFPVHEIATEMIRVSDNTATNLLIQKLGGIEVLNERFRMLGLSSTRVRNFLPDLQGTNTTSTRDLARTLELVDTGRALSLRSRDLFREVMSTSLSNRLLPVGLLKGLGGKMSRPDESLLIKGYRVYNKTGDIGISYADAGLIELPNGKRAVAGFIVKGPFNDPRSPELIREMAAAMVPDLRPKEGKSQQDLPQQKQ